MTQAVRLGIFSANVVAAWAEAHGVFSDAGIAVEQIPVASSPEQFRSLMAGEYDAVLTSPDNVATYVLNESNPLGRRLDLEILRAVDRGGRLSLVEPSGHRGAGGSRRGPLRRRRPRPPASPTSASPCCGAPAWSRAATTRSLPPAPHPAAGCCSPTGSATPPCSTPVTRPAPRVRGHTCSAW